MKSVWNNEGFHTDIRMGPFRPVPSAPDFDSPTLFASFSALSIHALTPCMCDDLENLRRVIRLIEEMDAYFAKLESPPAEPLQPVDRGLSAASSRPSGERSRQYAACQSRLADNGRNSRQV